MGATSVAVEYRQSRYLADGLRRQKLGMACTGEHQSRNKGSGDAELYFFLRVSFHCSLSADASFCFLMRPPLGHWRP